MLVVIAVAVVEMQMVDSMLILLWRSEKVQEKRSPIR